jgi:carbon-monoxide dehydrogenase large subunit
MGASDFSKLPHIGESLRRKEDYRFLTGAGNYTDDIRLDNMTHAVFVRSPHAHANIKSINKTAALAAPGVVAVLDGPDVVDAKINGLPCGWLITDTSGKPMNEPPHPILANGKVRYVGDHVAMVVAETLEQAKNQHGNSPARRSTQQPLLQLGHWRQGRCRRCVRRCGTRYQARPD